MRANARIYINPGGRASVEGVGGAIGRTWSRGKQEMHRFSTRPSRISTARVRPSAIRAVSHWPEPQAMPRLATTQIEAAVVRPWTLWCESSRRITPPPRNPMPAITPCTTWSTEPPSTLLSVVTSSTATRVISAAPRATRPWVRIPAGLPWISRLRPSTQPITVATSRRRRISPGPTRSSPPVIGIDIGCIRSPHLQHAGEHVGLTILRVEARRGVGGDPERIEGPREGREPLVVAEEEAVRGGRVAQVPGGRGQALTLGEALAAVRRDGEVLVHQHVRGVVAQRVIRDPYPALGGHGHGGREVGGVTGAVGDPDRRAPGLAAVGRAGESNLIG